jgi:pyruvate formate lyase activating enzyme
MIIRTPIIPGYNDTAENATSTANFLGEIGLNEINLLPFHRLGASKYEQLGITYEYAEQASLRTDTLEPLAQIYRTEGITCYLGWNTPF